MTPNAAGDLERRLISADQKLYRLGVYGADFDAGLSIRVGAVAATGRVLGIRRRPLTVDDIHEQLRPDHADLYQPAVCYFNSSVTSFVEIAWRWRAAVELLRAYPSVSDREAARSCIAFQMGVTELDPALGDRDLDSLWIEAITEVL